MSIDFKNLPHPGIRSLVPYTPGKSIEELKKEKGLSDIIKMASNENPLGCSPLAQDVIHNLSSILLATYPSPNNHELKSKLAHKLHLNPAQLFLSNGSDSIFGLLIQCFALHLDKHVVTHDFAFSTYAIQANALQVEVVNAAVNDDFSVDVEQLVAACNEHTALVFLANPNNPSGLHLTSDEIKYLLDKLPSKVLLVIDEAYYEYTGHLQNSNSLLWLEQYSNLIITRTFSKIYGLAGLRIGYALANPEIISILQRVQLPFAVNQVALESACAALDDNEFLKRSISLNQAGMKQLKKGFDELNISYLPSACNFLTFKWIEDSLMLYNYLLNHGIIIRPLHPYSMSQYLRVSIGTKEQNQRFLQVLKQYNKIA